MTFVIYVDLWCFNILLSGFILLFSRICWKIRINIFDDNYFGDSNEVRFVYVYIYILNCLC